MRGGSLVPAEENNPLILQRLRSGALRLRSDWLPILQTAIAACLAWFLPVLILGLERPTFAPIAAVIVLGLAVGERLRRALELTVAVAFGVAMADLLLSVVGVGAEARDNGAAGGFKGASVKAGEIDAGVADLREAGGPGGEGARLAPPRR